MIQPAYTVLNKAESRRRHVKLARESRARLRALAVIAGGRRIVARRMGNDQMRFKVGREIVFRTALVAWVRRGWMHEVDRTPRAVVYRINDGVLDKEK